MILPEPTDPQPYVPRADLAAALRWWWLMTLFMIAGGGLGAFIHSLQPPIYEARAVLSTSIDYSRTGAMTDIEQDNAVGIVGDVITSPAVLDQTVAAAQSAGIQTSLPAFKAALYAERTDADWYFRVRDRDPDTAAALANLWAGQSYSALTAAREHALLADALLRRADHLAGCVEQVALAPVEAVCQDLDFSALQLSLSDTSAQASAELKASLGVLPAMGFLLSERAAVPTAPARYGQSLLVLAGALAGLVGSIWAIAARLPDRLFRSRRVR